MGVLSATRGPGALLGAPVSIRPTAFPALCRGFNLMSGLPPVPPPRFRQIVWETLRHLFEYDAARYRPGSFASLDALGCGPLPSPVRGGAVAMRALIVGGSPHAASPELVARFSAGADAVVAVDRGLDALLAAGLGCDLFCGDADSVSDAGAVLVSAAEAGEHAVSGSVAVGEVERYDPHKDDTDLGLALRALGERWPRASLACTCMSGGKPDHALAVMGRLATWGGTVAIEEDCFSARILHAGGTWVIKDRDGARFSFVPLSAEAVVSESGMEWTLDRKRVPLLSDLGISNVLRSDARITCHEGMLAAYVFA